VVPASRCGEERKRQGGAACRCERYVGACAVRDHLQPACPGLELGLARAEATPPLLGQGLSWATAIGGSCLDADASHGLAGLQGSQGGGLHHAGAAACGEGNARIVSEGNTQDGVGQAGWPGQGDERAGLWHATGGL